MSNDKSNTLPAVAIDPITAKRNALMAEIAALDATAAKQKAALSNLPKIKELLMPLLSGNALERVLADITDDIAGNGSERKTRVILTLPQRLAVAARRVRANLGEAEGNQFSALAAEFNVSVGTVQNIAHEDNRADLIAEAKEANVGLPAELKPGYKLTPKASHATAPAGSK